MKLRVVDVTVMTKLTKEQLKQLILTLHKKGQVEMVDIRVK